jgi:ATP-binding cassette, subfamily B, bacterial CvaB/MchF/RaxB
MDDIRRTLSAGMVESLIDGVLAVGSLAMMLIYSPQLAAVSMTSLTVYALLRAAAYAPFREVARRRLALQAIEATHFLESLRAIVPIRLFDRAASRRSRWQNYLVDIQNLELKNGRLDIGFTAANTLLMGLENILVIWLAAKMVAGDGSSVGFTVGMLLAYLSFKFQFAGRVSRLIDYAIEWRMLSLHIERVSDIALARAEPTYAMESSSSENLLEPGGAHSTNESDAPATLEVRGLRFRYGDTEPWIIDGVDFSIDAGDCVAITGPSGCGKSTLVKLMLGLLVPTEGEILLDGRPLPVWKPRALRARMAAVMQDDLLLMGTIAEVEECVRRAQVHDDIQQMPMRYFTRVGDLGSGLSGGQRQRIFLARALYRRPGLLVMDEATSHLDVRSEHAVGAAIAEALTTRVIIAHREETLRTARRLIRMAGGRVVEDRVLPHAISAAA